MKMNFSELEIAFLMQTYGIGKILMNFFKKIIYPFYSSVGCKVPLQCEKISQDRWYMKFHIFFLGVGTFDVQLVPLHIITSVL